jgi:glycerol-3-phosphate O-acyltransferase
VTATSLPRLDRLARDDTRPRLLLLATSTEPEREVVDAWLERERARDVDAPLEVLHLRDPALERRLEEEGDPLVCPIGVAWLPPEHRGHRRARVRHLLPGRDPWHPDARRQRRILRDEPDRCEIVVAEPATASDLRRRFGRSGAGAFADFVRRQAQLALERAERAIVGVQYKVPKLVFEEITDSAAFRDGAEALARELGCPPGEVMQRAETALGEMVAGQSRTAIDAWDQFGRYMARAHRIEVDDEGIERLRELGRRRSLVFLPSHRSYLDPLVLRPALLAHGLPPNHVIGGLNVSFWPVGPVTRRSSYVFIRRRMSGDEVYKWTLRQYLGYLARKRFNLEWYIEGGRSRTGKLRPPRYGILSYLVDGIRQREDTDAVLVPTSITYEQLHEVGDMAAQARGATKTKEDLPWLVGYARSQGRGLGRVHVRFGEPLPLREALGAAADPQAPQDAVRLAVQKTAFEVCHRINTVTPVTHTALVALALLGEQQRALTEREVVEIVDRLVAHCRRRGVRTPGDAQSALRALAASKVLDRYDGGQEPVYAIAPDQHLVAAFYANSGVHAFLLRAIAELARDAADPAEDAQRLRRLLEFEFFFPEREAFAAQIATELAELDGPPLVAGRVLRAIAEAHLVVATRLTDAAAAAVTHDAELTKACLGMARQWHMQGRIRCGDAASSELVDSALKLAAHRGLLEGPDATVAARTAFRDELAELCERL